MTRTDNGYWKIRWLDRPHIRGVEQMLRILGWGHSAPTVAELIFVREQRHNHFLLFRET
jgi:hypothetical protein